MIRTLRAASLGWFLSLLCCSVLAFDEPAGDHLQPVPPLTGPVVDLTHTLTEQQSQQLGSKLRGLREKYGAQMQVLIVPTTRPEDAFTYSMRVVETWELGTKEKDDGLLLLIALDDRKTQIQTGYGLEGVIPDIVAKSLLRDTLAPFLRKGDFAGGIDAVIDGVFARISGEVAGTPSPREKERVEQMDWVAVIIVGAIATAILSQWLGNVIASVIGAAGVFWLAVALYGTSIFLALLLALATPFVARLFRQGHGYSGGWSGGGGGSFGGGGWSGGGGGFGGGGAGGDW